MKKTIITSIFLIITLNISNAWATHPLLQEVADGEQQRTLVIPEGVDEATIAEAMKLIAAADPNKDFIDAEKALAKTMSLTDLRSESTLLDKRLEIIGNYNNEIGIKSLESLIFWTSFHENASRKLKAVSYCLGGGAIIGWAMNLLPLPCDVQSWAGIASGLSGALSASIYYIAYKSGKAHKERSKEIKREMDQTYQKAGIVDREISARKPRQEPLIPTDNQAEQGRVWAALESLSSRLNEITMILGRVTPHPDEETHDPVSEENVAPAQLEVVLVDEGKGKEDK